VQKKTARFSRKAREKQIAFLLAQESLAKKGFTICGFCSM